MPLAVAIPTMDGKWRWSVGRFSPGAKNNKEHAMDPERFDHFVSRLGARLSRRTLGGLAIGVAASLRREQASARKKKKRACAKQCADGCCTSTFGRCIHPAQQGGGRCGIGGELCHACDDDQCRPLGGVCEVNAECCEDFPNLLECQDRRCCKPVLQPCTTPEGCCPQLICDRSALETHLACRGTWGAPCSDTDQCGVGRFCSRGRCRSALNMPCELDEHCSEANYLCRVVPGYLPDKVCCLSSGSFCIFGQGGENQQCCSGHCNENEQCA